MTKLNSKKMSKSTFAVIIMAIAMVALLAFGGTYAWFTSGSAAAEVNDTNTGTIKMSAAGSIYNETALTENVLPGEPVFASDADLVITDESNRESYIFIEVTIKAYKATNTQKTTADHTFTADLGTPAVSGATDTTKKLAPVGGSYTGVSYFKTDIADADGDATYTISAAALEAEIPEAWTNQDDANGNWENATIEVSITVRSIQGTFDTAQAAYAVLIGA